MNTLPHKIPTPIVTDRAWTVLEYFLKRGSTYHSGPNFYSTPQIYHPLFQTAANQNLYAALSQSLHETLTTHPVGSLCLFHDRIAFIRDSSDRPIGFMVAFSHVDLGDYCGLKVEDIWLDPGEDQIMNSIRWESLSVPSWTLLNVLMPKYGILIAPHRLLTEPLQHDYWDVRKKLWSIWELRYVPNRGLTDLNQDRRILTFKGLDLAKLEDHTRRPMAYSLESMTEWGNNEVRPSSMFNAVYINPAILGAETTEVMDEHPQDLICEPTVSEPNEDISK